MEICDIQRVIYQIIMLFSAMRILAFAQEADENGVVQVSGELAEPQIIKNDKKSVPKAGWEIQKEGQGFVTVFIYNGDGYVNFLDWMREASDESVKYLTVDLTGTNITIYLEEILAGRDLWSLTIQNGGNVSVKDIQTLAAGELTKIEIYHVFSIDTDVISHIRKLEEITVRLDGHYKGVMPTKEMSGNGECEKILLLWDDKMAGQGLAMDGEGTFGCLKEKEALERELAGQNKWLKAVYKQNEGDYSYTSYDFFQGNEVSDIFICIKDRESGGERYWDMLSIPGERLSEMDEGTGSRFCLEDINFDGYEDMVFLGCNDGIRLYLKTVVYLWNETSGKYELCGTAPRYFKYVDRERKRMIWSERNSVLEDNYYIYEYENEVFREKRLEVTFTGAGEVTWNYYEDGELQKRLHLSGAGGNGAQYVFYNLENGTKEGECETGEIADGVWWQDTGKRFFPEFDFYNNG